jgi:hypothetical protein
MARCRKSAETKRWTSELTAGNPAIDTVAPTIEVFGIAPLATSVICCASVIASAV